MSTHALSQTFKIEGMRAKLRAKSPRLYITPITFTIFLIILSTTKQWSEPLRPGKKRRKSMYGEGKEERSKVSPCLSSQQPRYKKQHSP
jgi:hypothetical protein